MKRKNKETPPHRRRRHRSRPVPRWLTKQSDLDEVGRRRCLLMLSVLSGEKPVTDAIAEAQISRPLYYQLEERALRAMLAALTPGATEDDSGRGLGAQARVAQMEKRIAELERDKRRGERLLLLTRKVMRGTVKAAPGRPPNKREAASPSSTSVGRKRSRVSRTKAATPSMVATAPTSTPTPDGEGAV